MQRPCGGRKGQALKKLNEAVLRKHRAKTTEVKGKVGEATGGSSFLKSYLFLALLGLCCCTGFSLVVENRARLYLVYTSFSLSWLLLLQSAGFGHAGSSSCSSRTLEQQPWCTGLAAPQHCGIFPDPAWNPCPLH